MEERTRSGTEELARELVSLSEHEGIRWLSARRRIILGVAFGRDGLTTVVLCFGAKVGICWMVSEVA